MKKDPIKKIKKVSQSNFNNVLELLYDYCGHFENDLKNDYKKCNNTNMSYPQFCVALFSNFINDIKHEE